MGSPNCTKDLGSIPSHDIYICLRVSVFVLSSVGSGLVTGSSTVQEAG
jgi:hypothetical protein